MELAASTTILLFLHFLLFAYFGGGCVWELEDSCVEVRGRLVGLASSFRHVDSRDWTRVASPADKCLYPLSSLAGFNNDLPPLVSSTLLLHGITDATCQ